MIRKKHSLLIIMLLSFLIGATPAYADGGEIEIVDSTVSISAEIRAAVLAQLNEQPPAETTLYAITYASPYQGGYAVSVAGLSPMIDEEIGWSLERGEFLWMGTLHVTPLPEPVTEMEAEYLTPLIQPLKVAAPANVPGGGPEILFPWQAGKGVLYGPRGVHAAGYGTSGMYAIDAVVGDDIGTNIAQAMAYAAAPGKIDYICADENAVAVRTYDLAAANYFIYAHLLPNGNLIYNHEFGRGDAIGSLKYGSFSHSGGGVDCGWANQQPDHAHLHWGFTPANGTFRASGCVINVGNSEIVCGTSTIRTGGILLGGGGTPGLDDPYDVPNDPWSKAYGDTATFFDLALIGVSSILDAAIIEALPPHNSAAGGFISSATDAAVIIFRIAHTMFRGNLNLTPIIGVASFWLGVWGVWGGIRIVLLIFQTVRLLLLR